MPGPGVREFRQHLRRIERAVAEQLKVQTRCCGVTLAQCHTLIELGDLGATNLAGLSARLRLDASTQSRTVESLVRAGLVRRTIDAANRRAVVLALTEKGRQRLDAIHRSCDAYYGRMLASLPEKKRPLLLEGMRLIAEAMAAKGGCDG